MRLLIKIIFLCSLSLSSFAQTPDALPTSVDLYKPIQLPLEKVVTAIHAIQNLKEFPILAYLPRRGGNPPLAKDQNSQIAQMIRKKFDDMQSFLFRGQTPFELYLCEVCDLKPNISRSLILYVDVNFVEQHLQRLNPELIDLDLAHAFSHYLIELYILEVNRLTPAGNQSVYIPVSRSNDFDYDGQAVREANYHAEVDIFAAGLLRLMGKPIPDFQPVVDLYRDTRLTKRGKLGIPQWIYADQETRVNTLRWARDNWISHP
ncbi:MAG: hypothetical protein AB7F59_12960 [Bdellovibrionales bacterium]